MSRRSLPRMLGMAVALLVGLALFAPREGRSQAQEGAPDDLVAVLNARNPTRTISRSQLQALYLGTTSFWHGVVPVRLISRPGGSPAGRRLFDVLGLSGTSFNERWQARQLAGQGVAPREAGSPAQVIQQVGAAPGAIGVLLNSEAWNVDAGSTTRFVPIN